MNETIGKILADARAKSGMSIEEVARITRINAKFIRLLEENRFDQLPGLVFIKGLLRTYSAVLGLSGDEMVEKFDALGVELTDQSPRLISMPLNPNKKLGKKIASTLAALAILCGIIYYYAKPVPEEQSAVIDDSFRRKVVTPNQNEPQPIPAIDAAGVAPEQSQTTANPPAAVASTTTPQAAPVKAEEPKAPTPVESQLKKAAAVQPVAVAAATPAPQPQKKPAEPAKQTAQPQKKAAEPVKPAITPPAAVTSPTTAQPLQSQSKTAADAAKPAQEGKPANSEKKESEKSGGKLTVTASEESWVGVVIDGSDQRQVILQPGQSATFRAGKRFRLTVGNVKATKAYLNGEEIKFKNVLQNVMKDMELPVGQKRASQTETQQDSATH